MYVEKARHTNTFLVKMMEKSALNENTTKKYTSNEYFYWKTVGFSLILKIGCDNYQ